MPRFTAPPPNGETRRALEQRAREAAQPVVPEKKGRWPFPVAEENAPKADAEQKNKDANEVRDKHRDSKD